MSVEKSDLIIPAQRVERARPYEPPAVAGSSDAATLMQIVERAMREPNFDIDKIQQMLALKERWDANEARKAFTVAMAEFKANPPKIVKNKHVKFQTSKGVTEYDHATHSEVVEKIAAGLGQHGISHRWTVEQDQARIRVTCIITHSLGHSEQVSLTAVADDSGSKNSIQAIGSAITYLQRYTLISATGLTTADLPDDDGRGAGGPGPDCITEKQAADIRALLDEINVNEESFLRTIKAASVEAIKAGAYQTVIGILEARRKK